MKRMMFERWMVERLVGGVFVLEDELQLLSR